MSILKHNIVFSINGYESSLEIPIQCPNTHKGCKSQNLKKNGHDTSVKSKPQKFLCKDCKISFYAHTSAFYCEFDKVINEALLYLFKGGKLNVEAAKQFLSCANSSVSRILKEIMDAIDNSIVVKMAWKSPVLGKILFVDETWIKIMKKEWYLVVVVDEGHHVLAWDLIKRREADVILSIIRLAISRLKSLPPIIVSDDFSTYKNVATSLGYDLMHVRHIHKPPYNRMIMDIIHHELNTIKITHVATTNDIFCNTNTFLTRVLDSEIKIYEKGKRGRKIGGKNKPRNKRNKNKRRSNPIKKKRGPKDVFKEGITQVYHFNRNKTTIEPLGGADIKIAKYLETLGKFFIGKNVTTNSIEQQFTSLKCLINFRGKRSLAAWKRILSFYFTIREFPGIMKHELNGLKLCPRLIHRSFDLMIRLLNINNKLMSEVL